MQVTIPVTPYIATFSGVDNVVLSLLGLAPTDKLILPVRPPVNPQFPKLSFGLGLQEMDVQAMVDLGFSAAVTFAAKSNVQAFFYLSDLAASWIDGQITSLIALGASTLHCQARRLSFNCPALLSSCR